MIEYFNDQIFKKYFSKYVGFIEMIAGGYTFEIRISAKLQTSDHLAFRASNYLQHFPELTRVEGVSITFKETFVADELGYLGDVTIIFNSQTVSPYDDPQAITDLVRQTVFKIANPSEAAPSNSSILSPDNRQRRIETGNPYQPTSIE